MKIKRKNIPKKPPVKRIKVDKTPKEGTYQGNLYESFCELSLLFFVEELRELGYVNYVNRSDSYLLCEPLICSYAQRMKKASKNVQQTIQQGCTYTPDYDICFTEKALGVFCWELGSNSKWNKNLLVAQRDRLNRLIACCEVKPDFSRNSTTPKSVQSMKWLYQRHKIFVNLFRPNMIFKGLFTPTKYLVTDRGTPRKLHFTPKNIQQYIKTVK